MRRSNLPLQSFRLKNFKAVRDSGSVRFTPLTVFIGNNGSGKSSLVEGLEFLQVGIAQNLDEAVVPWRGIEHIWNKSVQHNPRLDRQGRPYLTNPLKFSASGFYGGNAFTYSLEVGSSLDFLTPFVFSESYYLNNTIKIRREAFAAQAVVKDLDPESSIPEIFIPVIDEKPSLAVSGLRSILPVPEFHNFLDWQFLTLAPQNMGAPTPQRRSGGQVRLTKDGSNIAEYLLDIQRLDSDAYDGIVETLQYVLPYAQDVQPVITTEIQRLAYLQLAEAGFKIPGWLLSTGTLRVLALLAVLRHPNPPPVLIVEEIENGLDPRTIHLIVEEIRTAVESGTTQVILTTHSPYLLDLLSLNQIVVVERDETGSPVFTRPGDNESLKKWVEKFSPGQLYTMGRLGRSESE